MSSPFENVLNTNYCPTQEELVQIRDLCIQPEREVRRIDTELGALQAQLHKLRMERVQFEQILVPHRALLSPIRQLSPELLQRIFAHCLPTEHSAVMHASQAPILLTRICRPWRNIAHETAELWASIHLAIPKSRFFLKNTLRFNAFQSWIGRSGQLPLHISITCDHHVGDFLDDVGRCLQYVASLSMRLQSLELRIPPAAMSYFAAVTSLPILNRFSIHGFDHHLMTQTPFEHQLIHQKLSFLRTADNIRSLTLSLCEYDFTKEILDIFKSLNPAEFVQLDLVLHFDTVEDILTILALCPRIRKCSLKGSLLAESFTPSDRTIQLFCLEELTVVFFRLGDDESPAASAIADSLTAPMLRVLEIRSLPPTDNTFRCINRFLTRSGCLLRTFSLGFTNDEPFEKVISCLELMPELQELSLSIQPFRGSGHNQDSVLLALMELTETGSSNLPQFVMCPKLRRLSLYNMTREVGFTEEQLIAFLALRTRYSSLKFVKFGAHYDSEGVSFPYSPDNYIYRLSSDAILKAIASSPDSEVDLSIQLPWREHTLASPWLGLPGAIQYPENTNDWY